MKDHQVWLIVLPLIYLAVVLITCFGKNKSRKANTQEGYGDSVENGTEV